MDVPVTVQYERHQLPATLEDESNPQPCRLCGRGILWGRTTKGKRVPFDVEPPHPNHWITCTKQAQARRAFPG